MYNNISIYIYVYIYRILFFFFFDFTHSQNKTLESADEDDDGLSVGWWLRRSIFHQSVNVVLGSVLRRGHFENISHALQRLLRVSIRHHLRRREKK
jgi:hypothetical protein